MVMALVIPACGGSGEPAGDEASQTETSGSSESDSSSTSESDTSSTSESGSSSTSESGSTTESDSSTSESDSSSETGGLACESELPAGDWLFMLTDGTVFPDGVPNDVDETCTVLDSAAEVLALDCPFATFELSLFLTPSPTLPSPGSSAQVRVHHEPGWLNWPDLWISVDVEGGDLYGLQLSSVLHPTLGSYEVPGNPSLSGATCGPFVTDNCGEQVGEELTFEVDGEQVSVWHASYADASIGGAAFEVWQIMAREYLALPEFCDQAPNFYMMVTRRERL